MTGATCLGDEAQHEMRKYHHHCTSAGPARSGSQSQAIPTTLRPANPRQPRMDARH
ncbi:hypothetical protein CERZMDRAFT_90688 [Cercospora zeae-maydis SCOH1-5]|uniref:Uncharacterized protein n=1 Tax=Cercospora zeae-maydis SCOH1-5 TaxID=717836 RepID=A0A6A6FHS7_9PEZI|nr:hypothetical protein CERZMDRAFT_90688 [Cercospora zeae-maydis SCOH1-5]